MIKDRDGNILCQKIGTKKTHHLSPLLAKNPELMKERGWAIVETPQAPPKLNGEYKQPETVSTTVDSPAEYKNEELNLENFNKKIDSLEGQQRQEYLIKVYSELGFAPKEGVNFLGTMYNEVVKKLSPANPKNKGGRPKGSKNKKNKK